MRVVLNATGLNPVLAPFIHHRPAPLFRVVDKPLIVHIVESLQILGVRHFDILLHHLPQMIEECLGDGRRWGIQITYHLVRDADKPFAAIAPAAYHWSERMVLVGHAEILPKFHEKKLDSESLHDNRLFFHGSRGWIGWGFLSVETIRHLDRNWSYFDLPEKLKNYHKYALSGVMLSVKTLPDWQMSNQRALSVNTPKNLFLVTARMIEPGIWISRATVLHPSVVLRAPVFIGENCQVMEDAHIGPDVVIENHCIIDKRSSIIRSLVCQRSYVGEGLEMFRSIVDQQTLYNLTLGTAVNIRDDFILCNVAPPILHSQLRRILGSIVAFLLLILFSPFVIAGLLWYGSTTQAKVQLPATEETYQWTTFEYVQLKRSLPVPLLSRLVELINIARGNVHFVGLRPRSPEEVATLLSEHRRFIFEGKCGWIAVTEVERDAEPAVVESLYMTRQNFFEDLKLALRFFFSPQRKK